MNKKTKKGQKHLKTMLLPFYYIYIIQDICIMHYSLCIIHYTLYQLLTRFLPASILRKIKRSIVKPHNELPP